MSCIETNFEDESHRTEPYWVHFSVTIGEVLFTEDVDIIAMIKQYDHNYRMDSSGHYFDIYSYEWDELTSGAQHDYIQKCLNIWVTATIERNSISHFSIK